MDVDLILKIVTINIIVAAFNQLPIRLGRGE